MNTLTTFTKTSARNMILGQLMTNDILDERLLQAMAEMPREAFVPEHLHGAAYVDQDLEIVPGRYLMAPLTFAMLLVLARITPSSRVLVVGCLTGYPAAVIARLAKRVIAIDSDESAITQAQASFQRMGIANTHFHAVESLADGYGMSAPYDAIVICGAVRIIPETLGAQLTEGGRLVTVRNISTRPDSPVGLGKGLLVEKIDGQLQHREHFDASSALLPDFAREAAFIF